MLPKKNLRAEHVFLTGAGSGIGRYMAVELAKQGCNLSLSDINMDGLKETQNMISRTTGKDDNVILLQCDVSDKEQIAEGAQKARDAFGDVTILINNAGIVSGKKILEVSDFMMKKTFEVNCLAHLYTIREFLPAMLRRNNGHIVSIVSVAGTIGAPGLTDYCASKFGAFGIDEALRLEMNKMGKNIKTTCICPFFINTGMFEGAKGKWPFRVLDQHWVVKRIIQAIRQEESVVMMPWFYNASFVVRAFFPVCVADWVGRLFGGNEAMDEFKGRKLQEQLLMKNARIE